MMSLASLKSCLQCFKNKNITPGLKCIHTYLNIKYSFNQLIVNSKNEKMQIFGTDHYVTRVFL